MRYKFERELLPWPTPQVHSWLAWVRVATRPYDMEPTGLYVLRTTHTHTFCWPHTNHNKISFSLLFVMFFPTEPAAEHKLHGLVCLPPRPPQPLVETSRANEPRSVRGKPARWVPACTTYPGFFCGLISPLLDGPRFLVLLPQSQCIQGSSSSRPCPVCTQRIKYITYTHMF